MYSEYDSDGQARDGQHGWDSGNPEAVPDTPPGDEAAPAPPQCAVGTVEDASKPKIANLPITDGAVTGPVVTAVLTKGGLEFTLTEASENSIQIAADAEWYALLLNDEAMGSCVDQFTAATAIADAAVPTQTGASGSSTARSELLSPVLYVVRQQAPDAHISVTTKRSLPGDLHSRSHKLIHSLGVRLGLSAHDRELVVSAAEIHHLLKLRHPENDNRGARGVSDDSAQALRKLQREPAIIEIIRAMYRNLRKRKSQRRTLALVGGNILTITDLFASAVHYEEHLNRDTLRVLDRELHKLAGIVLLSDVVDAFVALLAEDVRRRWAQDKRNRVLIYSDNREGVYALESRLRNDGFRPTTVEVLDSYIANCKLRPPDMMILRLHSSSKGIIRVLRQLLAEGIDLVNIPAFLLVKASRLEGLASLLEMGIDDIMDLDGSTDVLSMKIKKVHKQLEAAGKLMDELTLQQSGSRGNLTDLSLVDLLQTLAMSHRSARVTVRRDDGKVEPLELYMAAGNLVYASLGALTGEAAIFKALEWSYGTWVLNQVAEEELPPANNDKPLEAILMEGCRLMDERMRDGGVRR